MRGPAAAPQTAPRRAAQSADSPSFGDDFGVNQTDRLGNLSMTPTHTVATAALIAALGLSQSGCIALAAGAVIGTAVGVTGKAVGLTAKGAGMVVGAVIPGGDQDEARR